MPRRPPVALLLAAGALALAGCTSSDPAPSERPGGGPVDVALPPADPEAVQVCAALAARLPDALGDDLARREVSSDPLRSAAWGDPAITLACGVPPAGLPGVDGEPFVLGPPDDDRFLELLQDDTGDGNLFTTRGTRVTVALQVPDSQDAQSVQRLVLPLLDVLPFDAPFVDPVQEQAGG